MAALALLSVGGAHPPPRRARVPPKPHLLALLADDLGYYDTAIHNAASPTPQLAALANGGLLLDRHYVFRFCSPSRRSFLTGRLPTSITTVQPDGSKLCSDFLPLATQLLSEKLASVGYECHFVGKGHLGYQTTDHLPINRGFASHVGFLNGAESYSHGGGSADPEVGTHDLWRDHAPAVAAVHGMDYSADYYSREAVGIIEGHGRRQAGNSSTPLFLYLAIQNVHSPYTLPPAWQVRDYPRMGSALHTYANMLAMLDGAVGNVTAALHRAGMWERSLLLFTADNGGIGAFGNNFPLRGHKHDPWEGGTRAVAFLAGGVLPNSLRGARSDALVHISDWYPTFATLAGATPSDDANMSGAVHPIDGVDVWPLLTGRNTTQPRPITVVTEVSAIEVVRRSDGAVEMWKLVTLAGQSNYYDRTGRQLNATDRCLDGRQPDPPQPGRTDPIVNGPAAHEREACPVCNSTLPCLYELVADPTETSNHAADATLAERVAHLAAAIAAANSNCYVTGSLDEQTLVRDYEPIDTKKRWKGFTGPCYQRKK